MANLVQGRIVRLKEARPDPQGENYKSGRMYVVLNDNESIANGDCLDLVAISSEIKGSSDEILLQYGNPGVKCFTGLTKKSAAICSWRETATQSEVEVLTGFVKGTNLAEITAQIDS